MKKAQAEAFAQKIQENMTDERFHAGEAEGYYPLVALFDTGNAVPALYLTDPYQPTDTPYQEENGALYFRRNGGNEVWTYTNGEMTRFPKRPVDRRRSGYRPGGRGLAGEVAG